MNKNLSNMAERYQGESGVFTSLDNNEGDGPLKCKYRFNLTNY